MVGIKDIEDAIKNIRPFTKNIIIYAPGYSAKAILSLRKILDLDYLELSRFLIKMRKKYLVDLDLKPDLLQPLHFDPYSLMLETFEAKFSHVLWLFSEAAYERAKKILRKDNQYVPNQHFAYMVKNYTYRGNIICSGLLMVQDYRKAIRGALGKFKREKFKLLMLPKDSFNRFGDDLLGENYSKLLAEFGIPIWVR